MSIDNKLNFASSMNRFTERKIENALQKSGKVLPASVVKQTGNMITVSFELRDIPYVLPQVTIPLFGPQYIRYPMQPGDKGIVIPADTYIGGVSGQGGGIADMTPPANLSALVFLPSVRPAAGVTALFTCFTAGYSLKSCVVNGNGVDFHGVSPNSRKVVLARRDSVVRSEVTRFRNKPYSI